MRLHVRASKNNGIVMERTATLACPEPREEHQQMSCTVRTTTSFSRIRMNEIETKRLLQVAIESAKAGGKVLAKSFFSEHARDGTKKRDGSIVTPSDIESEDAVRNTISLNFPHHRIVGEESGSNEIESDLVWYIDGLDGTRSFSMSIPVFSVMVGITLRNEPIVGVVHYPLTNETYFSGLNLGCWYANERNESTRLFTNNIEAIENARFCSASLYDYFKLNIETRFTSGLVALSRISSDYFQFGDSLAFCLLCKGQVDIVADSSMCLWDYIPIASLVTEAGGKILSLENFDLEDPATSRKVVASSSNVLLNEVRKYFIYDE